MTELQYGDREHGESPQTRRLGGLAARLDRSRGSLPAVLTSPAFADGSGPFHPRPRGGLGGPDGREQDDFATMEVSS